MARSDVLHFGLLNRWPVIMRESGWHFNQLAGSAMYAPLTQPCDKVYTQFERDDIADGLNQAVEIVAPELGFYPRPIWFSERLNLGHGHPMEWQEHRTTWGYLSEFSIRTKTLVQAAVAVVYSDEDGDGFSETATLTVATPISADELRAYFRVADGAIAAGDDDWEIEPLYVTSDGVTATLVGPKWLFTDPDVVWQYPYEDPNYKDERTFSSNDGANFVTAVDIYRVYGETTGAVKLLTDPVLDCSVANSGDIAENAIGRIVNPRLGLFQIRLADCASLTNCTYYPTQIWVSYKAGFPLRNQLMDRRLERALIRIANTKIPYQPDTFCGERTLTMWQNDNKIIDRASPVASPPPWGGMTMGEWDAWNGIKHLQLGMGGKITARG